MKNRGAKMGKNDVTNTVGENDNENENLNLFTSTQIVIHDALKKLGFTENAFEILKEPVRMLRPL